MTRLSPLTCSLACFFSLAFAGYGSEGAAKPRKGTVPSNDGLSIVYEVRGQGDTNLVNAARRDYENWPLPPVVKLAKT